MLDSMLGGLAPPGEREMDQALLAAVAGRAGETGDSKGNVGLERSSAPSAIARATGSDTASFWSSSSRSIPSRSRLDCLV